MPAGLTSRRGSRSARPSSRPSHTRRPERRRQSSCRAARSTVRRGMREPVSEPPRPPCPSWPRPPPRRRFRPPPRLRPRRDLVTRGRPLRSRRHRLPPRRLRLRRRRRAPHHRHRLRRRRHCRSPRLRVARQGRVGDGAIRTTITPVLRERNRNGRKHRPHRHQRGTTRRRATVTPNRRPEPAGHLPRLRDQVRPLPLPGPRLRARQCAVRPGRMRRHRPRRSATRPGRVPGAPAPAPGVRAASSQAATRENSGMIRSPYAASVSSWPCVMR
jgi:hypothetical protein